MASFFALSFIAGVLTVLAPCVLPILPIVIGTSVAGRSKWTPYVVVGSLSLSIIIFTYFLKASSVFIMVPPQVWTYLSGGIIFFFGVTLVWPSLWVRLPGVNKISIGSNKILGQGFKQRSFWGDILMGVALGPIFSTCSPTYFVILATVLPESFLLGSAYLFAYTIGLALILLFIALLGERFSNRLSGLADPNSLFKKVIGIIFIILGIMITVGLEKKLETKILDSGFLDVTKIENKLLERADHE